MKKPFSLAIILLMVTRLNAAPISIPDVDVRPDSIGITNKTSLINTTKDSHVSNLLKINPSFQLDFNNDKEGASPVRDPSKNTWTTYFQLLYGLYDHLDTSLFAAAFSEIQYWQIDVKRDKHDSFDWNKLKVFNSKNSRDSMSLSHNLTATRFSMRNMIGYDTSEYGLQSNPDFSFALSKRFESRNTGKFSFSAVQDASLNLDYEYVLRKVGSFSNETISEKQAVNTKLATDIFANDAYAFSGEVEWYYQNLGIPQFLLDSHSLSASLKNEFSEWNSFKLTLQAGIHYQKILHFIGDMTLAYIPSDFFYIDLYAKRTIKDKMNSELMEKCVYLFPPQFLFPLEISTAGGADSHLLLASRFKIDTGISYNSYSEKILLDSMRNRLYIPDFTSLDTVDGNLSIRMLLMNPLTAVVQYKAIYPLYRKTGQPLHDVAVILQYTGENFNGNLGFIFNENSVEGFMIPDTSTMDLYLNMRVRIQKNLWVIADSKNLLNFDNNISRYYKTTPLSISLGIRFDL